ncbi:MAG TPA: hypothetical protein VN419_01430, partial [Humidesulfovibrio sp.]|nr:hypothetical protein [Humidesulfovibrio sp.]
MIYVASLCPPNNPATGDGGAVRRSSLTACALIPGAGAHVEHLDVRAQLHSLKKSTLKDKRRG